MRGMVSELLFCLSGMQGPQKLMADIRTMVSTSSAVALAAASIREHLSANILVRGQHNISASSASLSLPSNHSPHCRCPPRLM